MRRTAIVAERKIGDVGGVVPIAVSREPYSAREPLRMRVLVRVVWLEHLK